MPNKNVANKARERPKTRDNSSSIYFTTTSGFEDILCHGYTSLAHNPEIMSGVDTIARLIGSMTIHLMQNTENGDIRVKNELSKKIDVSPNKNMVRSTFIQWIVRQLYIDGNGNCVVYPITSGGYLEDLVPIPPSKVVFMPYGDYDYRISISGKEYEPSNLLHFVLNPSSYYYWKGDGFRVALSTVADNLQQASATEKGFMSSKWKPSLIIKVDSLVDEFSNPSGRQQLLQDYIQTTEAGEPWLIPANEFEVQEVRPLSLSDLAVSDMVQLDKRTVASILGVPSFVLGVGTYDRNEWNNFINAKIMPLAKMIEQELTKKLLYGNDYFFKFNSRSLYNYDLKELSEIGASQYSHGLMTGNEVRDWIGLSPKPNLNELVILENYIPIEKIGDQAKLQGNEVQDEAE